MMQTATACAPFGLDGALIDAAPDCAAAAARGYLPAGSRVEQWPADFILHEARQTESPPNMSGLA